MDNEIQKVENTELQAAQNSEMIATPQYRSMWNDKGMLEQAFKVATYLSKSALVPQDTYYGRPENCLIAVDLANRSGMSPLTIMQNLYIVKGKPAWAGQFAIALVNGSRRFARPLKPVFFGEPNTREWGCYMTTTTLQGEEVCGAKITMQMAQDEGWVNKPGSKWKTMPEQMLQYRAGAFFARVYCPDVLYGIQMAEEVKDTFGYDPEEKQTVKIKCD